MSARFGFRDSCINFHLVSVNLLLIGCLTERGVCVCVFVSDCSSHPFAMGSKSSKEEIARQNDVQEQYELERKKNVVEQQNNARD